MACDPCDDCDSILFEPTIELIFINADSLDKINSRQTQVDSIVTGLTEELRVIDSILLHLNNRITDLNNRIENGEDLEIERQQALDSIEDFDELRIIPEENRNTQDSITTVLNEIRGTINSGLVLMNSIQVIEAESQISFDDSLSTSFSIPLSLDKSFFNYEVTIAVDTTTFELETNTLEVNYELFQEVDEDRNVLIRAQNIMIVSHSFDSLDACVENCLDGQSTFTFYF